MYVRPIFGASGGVHLGDTHESRSYGLTSTIRMENF